MTRYYARMESPLGPVLLVAGEAGLEGLYFADQQDFASMANSGKLGIRRIKPGAGVLEDGYALRRLRPRPRQGTCAVAAPFTAMTTAQEWAGALHMVEGAPPATVRALFDQTADELAQYWAGVRQTFDVTLSPAGTGFQQAIWKALRAIPYGQISSYAALADQAGFGMTHGRAAGGAVGRNPISILIPCHRILAGDGTLNGYGGGLARKRALLQLEGFVVDR